jgi:hypothetical protein
LVKEGGDLDAYVYGIRASVKLHAIMLEGIMDAFETGEPEWLSLKQSFRGTR